MTNMQKEMVKQNKNVQTRKKDTSEQKCYQDLCSFFFPSAASAQKMELVISESVNIYYCIPVN